MQNKNELDWSQRYRPTSMDEMVLPEPFGQRLREIASQKGGMSLLFYGRPGMGKTTAAKLINPDGTYHLNCTLENSVAKVKELRRTCSAIPLDAERRLVLLDEADYLTEAAQAGLRGAVEELSLANDFVMTANEPERLSAAIRSRFLPVHFDFILTDDYLQELAVHLWEIAASEGYGDVDMYLLRAIARANFPDIRKMIKALQFELMTHQKII
jgi:replication factor C small subunit